MKMQTTAGAASNKDQKWTNTEVKRKKKRNAQSLKTTAVFKTPGREETF
jgi:hypothetical protein